MSNPNGIKNLEAELAVNNELRQALNSGHLNEEQAELINRNLNSYTQTDESISLEGYYANRPYQDEDGKVHNPFNDEVVEADSYFQFNSELVGYSKNNAYEEMSKWDLAKIYSAALKAGDRTTTLNVAPVLRDKLAEDHESEHEYRVNGRKVTSEDDIDYAFDNLVDLASKAKKPVKSNVSKAEDIEPEADDDIDPTDDTETPKPKKPTPNTPEAVSAGAEEEEEEQPEEESEVRHSIEIPEEISSRIEAFKTVDGNIRICEVFDTNNADGEIIDWNNYPADDANNRVALLETSNEKYVIHGSKVYNMTKNKLIAEEEHPGDMPSTMINDIWEISDNNITAPIKKITINSIVIGEEDLDLINNLEKEDVKETDPMQEVIDFLIDFQAKERELEQVRIRNSQPSEAPTVVHETTNPTHSQELVVFNQETPSSKTNRVKRILNSFKTKLYTFNPADIKPKEFFTDKESGANRIRGAVTLGALAIVGYVLVKNGLLNGSESSHAHAVYTPNPKNTLPNGGMHIKESSTAIGHKHTHGASEGLKAKHQSVATKQVKEPTNAQISDHANSSHTVEAVDNSSANTYPGNPVSLSAEHNSIWSNVAANLHAHGIEANNPNTAKVTDYIVSHLPKNLDFNKLPVGYTFNMPSEQVIRELLNLPV